MLKKLFSLVLACLMLFTLQSQTFAAVKDAEKVDRIIQLEKHQFFDQSLSYELARRDRSRDNEEESKYGNPSLAGLWWLSIFIMGLGQLVMGDFWRALSFYGWLFIGAVVVFAIAGTGSNGNSLAYLWGLIIAIWSIIDAYNMSVEITRGYDDEDAYLDSTRMARLEKKLQEIELFASKVNVSGSNISFKALAF